MQPCDEGTRKISHIVDALPNSAEEEDVPNGACPRTQREEKIHVSELPEYKTAIGKTRRESWQRFVTIKENRDLWGAIYKLCSRKVTPGIVVATPKDWQVSDKERPTWETCVRALLDFLVLNNTQDITAAQKMKRRAADDLPTMNDVPPFDKEEVRHAIGNMKNGKAPGPDRIEVEVLKASYEVIHKELRDFNACLRCGSFPRIWKQGSIRTLLKDADRDATNLTSYRPICLLSVMEKCLEKLLAERLRPVFMDSRYAAANQFGFQKENRRRTRSWL